MKQIAYIIARLKERSTWLGLTTFAVGLGIALSPEQVEAIVATGTAVAGALSVFWPDVNEWELEWYEEEEEEGDEDEVDVDAL